MPCRPSIDHNGFVPLHDTEWEFLVFRVVPLARDDLGYDAVEIINSASERPSWANCAVVRLVAHPLGCRA